MESTTTKIPKSFGEYLRMLGPGIIMALTWWGAGDMVDSAAAGSSYGYALMWCITLAVLMRGVTTYLVGKYTAVTNETVMQGLNRISKIFSYLLIAAAIYYSHMYGAFLLKASAAAIWEISGRAGAEMGLFVLALVLGVISLVIWRWGMGKEWYKFVENAFKAIMLVVGVFLIATLVFNTIENPLAIPMMLINAVNFLNVPSGVGPWQAGFLAVGIIGAVGGSITNLFYSYYVKEKKWLGREGTRALIYDMGFAVTVLIVLNISIWTAGAEILRVQGVHVESISDIASALGHLFGPIGHYILLVGFFSAAYTTYIGCAIGLAMLATDILHSLKTERRKVYTDLTKDPFFLGLLIFGLVPPVIWSLPGMPGVIWLIIFGNATNVFAVPIIAIGVFILVTNKKYIGEVKTHPLLLLVLLAAVTISLWSAATLLRSLLGI